MLVNERGAWFEQCWMYVVPFVSLVVEKQQPLKDTKGHEGKTDVRL